MPVLKPFIYDLESEVCINGKAGAYDLYNKVELPLLLILADMKKLG